MSGITRFVASSLGWRFIPEFLVGYLLPIFHQVYRSVLRRQPPAKGTPEYEKHRRWTYTAVMFGYALYTFWDAATSIGPNYYQMLGTDPTADESDLKAGFRAFARRFHPDRAGPQAEPYFMRVRHAYDALRNPTTRFAYDRFGPDALEWPLRKTMSEYISFGLWRTATYYVLSICGILVWGWVTTRSLAFWHFVLLFATFAAELSYILSPSPSSNLESSLSSLIFTDPSTQMHGSLLALIWPKRVAYQHISMLRSLSVLLSAALHHIIPMAFPSTIVSVSPGQLVAYFSNIEKSIESLQAESLGLLYTELQSCHGEPRGTTSLDSVLSDPKPIEPEEPVKARLKAEIQNMLLEKVLYTQPGPLKSACDAAIARRRLTPSQQNTEHKRPVLPRTPSSRVDILGNYFGSQNGFNANYARARSISLG
ncbi:hypothetical protein BDW22DRAFT_710705 [Trametopsis cervina]|nr:hypothetical protein BDW22DRAFT_710705 [Trametopsis cervina]